MLDLSQCLVLLSQGMEHTRFGARQAYLAQRTIKTPFQGLGGIHDSKEQGLIHIHLGDYRFIVHTCSIHI
jgi:hypothetical protein